MGAITIIKLRVAKFQEKFRLPGKPPVYETVAEMDAASEVPVGKIVIVNGVAQRKTHKSRIRKAIATEREITPELPEATPIPPQARDVIKAAREKQNKFGKKLVGAFEYRTIMLGIGQQPKNVQRTFNQRTRELTAALEKGRLTIAIEEIKAIPANNLDGTYITAANLLQMRNKIHAFLGEPPVNAYDA
jgi:hypothetical protein